MSDESIPELSPEELRHQKRLASYARYHERHREKLLVAGRQAYAAKREQRLAAAKAARLADVAKARARDRAQRFKHHEKRLAYDRAYKAANLERLREAGRLQYHANPEKRRQKDRDSYKRHVEKRKRKSQNWRERNPERVKEYSKEYPKTHPDYNRFTIHKRKARKAAAPINDFTIEQWRALCKAAGYRCCYCGKKFPSTKLQPDHLTPYVKQGSNTLHNVLPCCGSCNSRKKDRAVLKPVQPFLLLSEDTEI